MLLSSEHRPYVEQLGRAIEAGDVGPAIGQRFRLEDTASEILAMAAGTASAKSVIVVGTGLTAGAAALSRRR